MADFDSSLPVRTETAGDVAAKIVDATTTSQGLGIDASGRITIKLDDGAGNIITSQGNGAQQALDVGINVAGVQVDPRDLRPLTSADVVTVNQGTNPWLTQDAANGSVVPGTAASKSMLQGGLYNSSLPTLTDGQQSAIQIDASGRLLIGSIADSLPAGTASIGKVAQDNSTQWVTSDLANGPVAPGAVAVNSMLVGAQFNTSLPTLTAAQQASLQVTNKGELITVMDIGGAPISGTNPVPVAITSALVGTPVNDYNTSASLAAGATSNHDYSITSGKTFNGKKIWASASGKMKIEVQVSPDGLAFTTKWVGFNSVTDPNISIDLDELVFLESGVGSKIRIIRTNKDQQAQDVYSTISGTEV